MPALNTLFDFMLVAIGFGLIIFIHELGHFLAARWAGIRVLAFAIGFGPALFSFRKGLGFRAGSSDAEYTKLAKSRPSGQISPTEYRFNVLPLGGYVRMLGQDDADPSARSDASDSYQNCPPVKRMVVISAGVIMNLITAAILFIIVFYAGLKTESASIGRVLPGSPAALAVAENAKALGITQPGLMPGDKIVRLDGEEVEAFTDMRIAVAMARKDRPMEFLVERPGIAERLNFSITPSSDPETKLQTIGVEPMRSGRLISGPDAQSQSQIASELAATYPGLAPGAQLAEGHSFAWLENQINAAQGRPLSVEFINPDGTRVKANLKPSASLQEGYVARVGDTPIRGFEHIAGLVPVMTVRVAGENALKAGLQAGDIFARLGETQWPSFDSGVAEIKAEGRTEIHITVLRTNPDGSTSYVDLPKVPVIDKKIGFNIGSTKDTSTLVARLPRGPHVNRQGKAETTGFPAGLDTILPGSRIVRVGETSTSTLSGVRDALQKLLAEGQRDIPLRVALPDAAATEELRVLTFTDEQAKRVMALQWESPINAGLFVPEEILIVRSNPLAAIGRGLHETRKMILTTYLTFARLAQGTVKVEHLKGPIGIAHAGTLIADRGFIWLLFFMAAVSVNLAVINFLPLPIVDGGHFLFLLYEQFTGKPVSIAVQNIAAIIGLALIGTVFLLTTYNDLANLLWR